MFDEITSVRCLRYCTQRLPNLYYLKDPVNKEGICMQEENKKNPVINCLGDVPIVIDQYNRLFRLLCNVFSNGKIMILEPINLHSITPGAKPYNFMHEIFDFFVYQTLYFLFGL